MKITLGPDVTRAGIDETITGLWTFANVLGLLTDVIGERTAAAGVTVDGLLIRDAGIPEAAVTAHEAALAILETQITDGTLLARLAANESVTGNWTFDEQIVGGDGIQFSTLPLATTFAYLARVLSDTFARFTVQADGTIAWGPGSGARDTNLFRAAANELRTNDSFRVDGTLLADGDIQLSVNDIALAANSNNQSRGGACIQRVDAAGAFAITGFASGVSGKILIVQNVNAQAFTLDHESVSSLAANRIRTPTRLNVAILEDESVILWYDTTTSRWRMIFFTT